MIRQVQFCDNTIPKKPQYFDADNDKKEQEGSGDWRMAKKNEQPDRSA